MAGAATHRVLILGIGNSERADDGIGPVIARTLEQCALPGVVVRQERGEVAGLVEALSSAENVIIVDAVQSGQTPGTIHRYDAAEAPLPTTVFHSSTHALGVAEAVELARVLGRLPRRLIIYGIEAKTFQLGAPLSVELQAVVDRVVAEILRDVHTWTSPTSSFSRS